jgi:hypothetical protein
MQPERKWNYFSLRKGLQITSRKLRFTKQSEDEAFDICAFSRREILHCYVPGGDEYDEVCGNSNVLDLLAVLRDLQFLQHCSQEDQSFESFLRVSSRNANVKCITSISCLNIPYTTRLPSPKSKIISS